MRARIAAEVITMSSPSAVSAASRPIAENRRRVRKPPYLLLLGNDASDGFRAALDALRHEVDAWETVSRGTDRES